MISTCALVVTGVLSVAPGCRVADPPAVDHREFVSESGDWTGDWSGGWSEAGTGAGTTGGDVGTSPGSDSGNDSDPQTTTAAPDLAAPENCSESGDACDKCCKAVWGDGASGSMTDNKCTHCNVPQGSYQTHNECKAVCQELNCETETYNLQSGDCLCGRCPGP